MCVKQSDNFQCLIRIVFSQASLEISEWSQLCVKYLAVYRADDKY